MIIRRALIGMLFIFSLGGLAPGPVRSAAGKPQPPVMVSILQEGTAVSPDRTLAVTVHANADVQEFNTVIEAKDGAELIAGDASWKGSLKKSDRHTVKITVRQSQQGKGIVRAVVTIPGPQGPGYSAQAEYSLSGKTTQQRRQVSGKETIRKDRRGKEVVEHALE